MMIEVHFSSCSAAWTWNFGNSLQHVDSKRGMSEETSLILHLFVYMEKEESS